jgi:hypothetical protein
VGPRTGLDTVSKRKIPNPPPGIEPRERDGRIALRLVLRRQFVRMRVGWNWLRIV